MPVSAREVEGRGYFVATGYPSGAEVIEALTAFHSRHKVEHAVWDFRDASLAFLTPAAFTEIASAADRFAAQRGPGAKTAVLVRNEADALLVKAFAGFAEAATSVVFRGFRDYEAMLAWLGERSPEA